MRKPSMRLAGAVTAAVVALAVAPVPSLAQQEPPTTIRAGETVAGTLAASDPVANRLGRFRTYQFEAREGERYVLTLRSSDFDAYLTVARTVAGVMDVLRTDDDGGGGTDSRIRFRAPATGTYLVVAQSFGESGLGAYQLRLEPAPEPAEAKPVALRPGQPIDGRLDDRSPVHDDDWPYDLYTFTARDGQRHTITMRSEEFDAYLRVERRVGGVLEHVASDDDGGGGTDARLTVSGGGEYFVYARPFGTEGMGAYTLLAEEAEPVVRRPPQPVRLGEALSGALLETDPQLESDAHYNVWTYTAAAGERLRITLRSEAFDAFVAIGRFVGERFEEIGSDDDGAGGTDSLLEITLGEAGPYAIRATSWAAGATGAYTLLVEQVR